MLEKINLEAIDEAVRQTPDANHFLYVERREEKHLEFSGRQQRARFHFEHGTRLETHEGQSTHVLTTEEVPKSLSNPLAHPHFHLGDPLEQARNKIETLLRKAAFDRDTVPPPRVTYLEVNRDFLTASAGSPSPIQRESFVHFEANFLFGPRRVNIVKSSHDVSRFWRELESDPLFLDPKLQKGWENPWPAPHGELPVLWSHEAVSKLIVPLLQLFQNPDGAISLWKNALPLRFDLEDQPSPTLSNTDHRGFPKISSPLIKNGVPTEIRLYESSRCPGLTRRGHYLETETVGFWNICLISDLQKESLLTDLQMGIHVQDLIVLAFNPSTTEVVLNLTNASLVHHGENGETIAPILLKCNLLDLFCSWEFFSTRTQTFGYWLGGTRARSLTEIMAPQAFSRQFFLPGSVSPSHYW